ncbi:hypothetical protein GCHA_3300 [Paraglaciecola chathamensis S18K6]|uniref:Uncharacterized protein n=1 Tax=Paraglaciecola chathamensis S18K6 TaxID=1127672 RepID=A0AAV3V3Z6_9ALTE|nr:hypothetical protein GCHA_3300 [Paraglaciecola chathamensis S18K6]
MQSSVSPFKTRLKAMPQQLLLCVLTIRKGTTILHSDALIKNRWTYSEGALINADWYY